MDGFLDLLKPPGMSSHDAINIVRKILNRKRVGHAGTLDPAAAGVLPIAVGQAARLVEYLELADKSYRAEIRFGIATDSGDDTGEVMERMTDFVLPGETAIRAVLAQFTGQIKQAPPAHSAIKIRGKRACDLVRRGVAVEIPTRTVAIHRLALLARHEDRILIDVDCSKGTYIRSLCADIGKALGIPATMAFLVRTRVGDFSLEDAHTIEALRDLGEAAILAPDNYLSHIERYDLAPHRSRAFQNGLATNERRNLPHGETFRVYSEGLFLGMGRYDREEKAIVPTKVFLREAGR